MTGFEYAPLDQAGSCQSRLVYSGSIYLMIVTALPSQHNSVLAFVFACKCEVSQLLIERSLSRHFFLYALMDRVAFYSARLKKGGMVRNQTCAAWPAGPARASCRWNQDGHWTNEDVAWATVWLGERLQIIMFHSANMFGSSPRNHGTPDTPAIGATQRVSWCGWPLRCLAFSCVPLCTSTKSFFS